MLEKEKENTLKKIDVLALNTAYLISQKLELQSVCNVLSEKISSKGED